MLSIHKRPWYAYGLLKAAELAEKKGYKRFTAIEFGVASGRGLKIMSEYKKPKELSGIGVFVNALYDACITKEGN